MSNMDDVRGSHACYVCQHPIQWAGHVRGEGMVLHGSEISAGIAVTGRGNGQMDMQVKLVCPACGAKNLVVHSTARS